MRILFICPSYKPAYVYGGPVVVISLLAETLVKLGHDVTVYTTTANGASELPIPPERLQLVDGVKVWYFKRITKDHTHISFSLWRLLTATIQDFDVVHLHSWWNLLIVISSLICKRKKIRPFLSPHGMFSDYIMNTNNAMSKRWMHRVLGKSLLQNSTLHVSTQLEWEESKKILPHWEGAIIPNPVSLPSRPYARTENAVFTIGFMSRIDPKKGLDILLQALANVTFSYRLVIAGDGEATYLQRLREMARRLGNDDVIEWAGWKNGDEKFAFLSCLDLFSLPSHSENFAIVIIESLSVGTPVLISKGVGLASYIDQYQLGWVTDATPESVASGLELAYREAAARRRIQLTSSQLIEEHFDPLSLAGRYEDFYKTNSVSR